MQASPVDAIPILKAARSATLQRQLDVVHQLLSLQLRVVLAHELQKPFAQALGA